MTDFQFNGDWEFQLKLEGFARIFLNTEFNDNESSHFKDLRQGLISICIHDYKSYDPDPQPEQIACLHDLVNNQSKVVEGIVSAVKVINGYYVQRSGESYWIPDKITQENLGLVLRVSSIEILTEHKHDSSYYQLNCDYEGDHEHGLSIVMHERRLIEYSSIGEVDYVGVYKDLGERAEIFRNANIKNREFGENQIHQVLPKYGKFKPWQKQAMTDHLSNLLRTKKTNELIDIIKGGFDFNMRLDYADRNLLDLACSFNNVELIEYLIGKGADTSQSMKACIRSSSQKEAIKCLVKHGISVDVPGQWGETPLYNVVMNYIGLLGWIETYKNDGDSRLSRALEEISKLKDLIQFYISVGADPSAMQRAGKDYKSIMRERWGEEYLKHHNVRKELNALLFPKKSGLGRLKFW